MKEIAASHNDWWTASRPLTFAPNSASTEIATWVQQLGDATDFNQSVKSGIACLEQSAQYQKAKKQFSLKATLSPLICETEINWNLILFRWSKHLAQFIFHRPQS